ncbi:unnamed protein product [Leptidea sinapis]|uniref:Uncharacterized protein n=1 Tax=Leptidea sinapis TaxID=189913 RepID=A0A5E4QD93_9NEOP|nr:unnamed protein product [Leptidea sinapis]
MQSIEQEDAGGDAPQHDIDDFTAAFTMIRNEPFSSSRESESSRSVGEGWESIQPEPARPLRNMFSPDTDTAPGMVKEYIIILQVQETHFAKSIKEIKFLAAIQ